MSKSTPPYIEVDFECTDEEHEIITAKANAAGLDFEAYVRFRTLTAGELPDPAVFLPLAHRFVAFVKDYEALIRDFPGRPEVIDRADPLGAIFEQLVEDWNAHYGPR